MAYSGLVGNHERIAGVGLTLAPVTTGGPIDDAARDTEQSTSDAVLLVDGEEEGPSRYCAIDPAAPVSSQSRPSSKLASGSSL